MSTYDWEISNTYRARPSQIDSFSRHRGVHNQPPLRPSDGDIEPALAAFLIERTKVHRDPACFIWAVADREYDGVPLIPLYVLKVLDENALVYRTSEVPLDLRMFAPLCV